MARTLKYTVSAVSVLAVGSVAAVLLSADAEAKPMAPAPLPVVVEPSPVASAPSAPVRAFPAPTPAPAAAPQREEQDAFRNWSKSVATLPKDLGQMGPSLKLALDNARNNDMAFCFRDMENGADASQGPHTIRASDFVLFIEARADAVDVVEAKVARPGTLPPSVVDCAREVLRGLEVKVFFSVPGERFSYIYEVEA